MSDLGTLQKALADRFSSGKKVGTRHIAFWHDVDGEYDNDLDDLASALGDVKVIRVHGDEYAVKHRLLKEEPDQSFIVYRTGVIDEDTSNWLLDLELAYGKFTANRTDLIAQDLGLPLGLQAVIRQHEKFTKSAERVQKLKALLAKDDDRTKLRAKMSAVLLRIKEHTFGELTRALLIENANGSSDGYQALADFGLADFYWDGARDIYGYDSPNPSIADFVLWVFRNADDDFAATKPTIKFDYGSWRNTVQSREAMAALARRTERDLQIREKLATVDYADLLGNDTYEAIDQKILGDLARGVSEQTLRVPDVQKAEQARQTTFWYGLEPSFRALYTAIRSAAELLDSISSLSTAIATFDDGLSKYQRQWYRIDQLYRQFLYAARTTEHAEPLAPLVDKVEAFYNNNYVAPLALAWQQQVDKLDTWKAAAHPSQVDFYDAYVKPLVSQEKRVVVVVSDALRYEVADELASRIRQEDKFDAKLDAVLGILPSYTQLGMAALLPHSTIGFAGTPAKGDVQVDGKPTIGTANRAKILQTVEGTALAYNAVPTGRDALRALLKEHKVVYIYHDEIDHQAHNLGSEESAPKAAEAAIVELIGLVKRLNSADASNIFITSDHGFLFQESKIDDGSKLSEDPHGDIEYRDRRFLLGSDFKETAAFNTWTSAQLGLSSEWQVHIPKSIYRLTQKMQGTADRFVHGGATLQEIVVPVIATSGKGKSDVKPVEVQIRPSSDKITTNNVVVDLFQVTAVSEKVRSRELRAGIYFGDQLISDQVTLIFNSEAIAERERFQQAKLKLRPDHSAGNGAQVEFRLEEPIAGTNHWKSAYKAPFAIKLAFTADF
ncbi:MAG: TIGR02687 family protein [Micrococcales bacterium 73-13]|mgnify:CR=1 FL=1|nr:MAG: TIGR02687 family protein [Micrococcales bacterium 73-13]